MNMHSAPRVVAPSPEEIAALARQYTTNGVRVLTRWGWYEHTGEGPGFKQKILAVVPGGCLSLQTHQNRSELWVVVHGTAEMRLGFSVDALRTEPLSRNDSINIPCGALHQLRNRSDTMLFINEIWYSMDGLDLAGLVEEDIERIQMHW